MPGTLYIVATPIGNLEDITLRALRIFKEVDGIIAEDTRRTKPLLTHFGIQKPLESYFEHSRSQKSERLLRRLAQGESLALVSDAGTPTLSDPGARLVAQARQENIPVVPIPGPCAFIAAISASGLPTEPLHFWGFLPPTASKRIKIYTQIQNLLGVHCIYESPHRLMKRLLEGREYFSNYYLSVGKEITKKFETFWVGGYEEVLIQMREATIKGEYTILLSEKKIKDKE